MVRSINGMAERFRAKLEEPGPIVLPGCHDVLSALISQDCGFDAVFMSGYGIAASLLGNPDVGLTTLSETAQMARNVVNAVSVPVVVDVDNGYGNEENVSRTIYEMESAGVSAIQLEDQIFPKRCGHAEGKKVLPVDLYLRKLEAALKARQTPISIIARTDSTDPDDAIKRAQKYLDMGAEAVIVDGLRDIDMMKRVSREVHGYKQLNLIYGGKTPLLSIDEAHQLGFKIVLYSTPTLYLTTATLRKSMMQLREAGNLDSISDDCVAFGDFQDFIETHYHGRRLFRS